MQHWLVTITDAVVLKWIDFTNHFCSQTQLTHWNTNMELSKVMRAKRININQFTEPVSITKHALRFLLNRTRTNTNAFSCSQPPTYTIRKDGVPLQHKGVSMNTTKYIPFGTGSWRIPLVVRLTTWTNHKGDFSYLRKKNLTSERHINVMKNV